MITVRVETQDGTEVATFANIPECVGKAESVLISGVEYTVVFVKFDLTNVRATLVVRS